MYFNLFVTLCCAFSSYIYAAMAAYRLNADELFFELMLIFEAVFVVDMLTHFLLSYRKEGSSTSTPPERDIMKCSLHYYKNGFLLDLIPLIPFQVIEMHRGRHNLFYLVKLMRLYKGFKIFNVPKIMELIKNLY